MERLAALQWLGLLGAALAWTAQFVLGFGVTQAACGAEGASWGVDNDVWQLALLAAAALAAIVAEGAAAVVFLRTRPAGDDDAPPPGRLHFLAAAALVANVVFLTIVVLSGVASVVGALCRQG